MYGSYFKRFCRERNIKQSTRNGYESTIKHYVSFHGQSLDKLIDEAIGEEEKRIPLKNRKLKKRLVEYRNYLLNCGISHSTSKLYFSNIKTVYKHFEIEIPHLPIAKYHKDYESNYFDIPTKEHIAQALDVVSIDLKAIILFMSSSGTAKAETLSLTVEDFINATVEYHDGGSLESVLEILSQRGDVVPTFYLKRVKTEKYYYTFCSPEATSAIVKYLKTRKNLKLNDSLFDFSDSILIQKFREINDKFGWGYKGKYRFFRTHSLRKFHASNIGLGAEYIDALQGRRKSEVHEAYIKTNPQKLKEIYASAMKNVMIGGSDLGKVENQEFTIVINVFLSGKELNIL